MARSSDWLLLLLLAAFICSAAETVDAQTGSPSAACEGLAFGDGIKGLRFALAGTCARLTGAVENVYQNDLSTHAGGVPTAFTSAAASSAARSIDTATVIGILDARRETPLGELSTHLVAQWQKASNDGTTAGTATVQSLFGSLSGATVGYTGSLMNFWNGDFQFLANTPELSVGLVSYEHEIADHLKLAAAIESGLPSSEQTLQGIGSLDFSSPAITGRLRYAAADGLLLHVSGLLRSVEFPANARGPFLSHTASTQLGWAGSFGAAVPVPITGTYDQASMQATYAVDAPQSLGTRADLASLEAAVDNAAPITGWSIVASLSHAWSAHLTSNAFVSYIALDADLIHAQPTVRTARFAANLYWRPFDSFRLGAEIGLLHSELAANGAAGFLSGVSGDGVIGFLSAQWSF